MKLLLSDERVDINKANNDGWTPFYIACYNGHIDIVKYLLMCGREIDINKKDHEGKTALDIARKTGKLNLAELIESFQKNQNETTKLRKKMGLSG